MTNDELDEMLREAVEKDTSELSGIEAVFNALADTSPGMEKLAWYSRAPSPEWAAQILMEISPLSEKTNWKRYALEIAELIGPDHIRELKRFIAFMAKVNEF